MMSKPPATRKPWSINPRPYFSRKGSAINQYVRQIPWVEGNQHVESNDSDISAQEALDVLDVIGVGTYSTVYRAYWKPYKQHVAVKVYEKRSSPSATMPALRRVQAEVESLQRLKHPYIVGFYGAIEDKSKVLLMFEAIETGNLLQYITANGPPESTVGKKWFAQLASALTFVHRNFIAHRDLKCENILLDYNNNIRLTDFGFAKSGMTWLAGSPNSSFTKTSEFCGSLAYMSPEIARHEMYSPILSDVWAMGVVLHAILCGSFPYEKVTVEDIADLPQHFGSRTNLPEDAFDLLKQIFQYEDKRIRSYQVLEHQWLKDNEEEAFIGKIGHLCLYDIKEYCSRFHVNMPDSLMEKLTAAS